MNMRTEALPGHRRLAHHLRPRPAHHRPSLLPHRARRRPAGKRRETARTSRPPTPTAPDDGDEAHRQDHGQLTLSTRRSATCYGEHALRAGLFESTGGVGVDQTFLAQALGLTFEAYEFDRDDKPPHLRLEARWFFHPNLFAYAGWDDPVWSERQSAFVGAGIRWSDEDLKYLLGTAAAAAP